MCPLEIRSLLFIKWNTLTVNQLCNVLPFCYYFSNYNLFGKKKQCSLNHAKSQQIWCISTIPCINQYKKAVTSFECFRLLKHYFSAAFKVFIWEYLSQTQYENKKKRRFHWHWCCKQTWPSQINNVPCESWLTIQNRSYNR